MKLPSALAAVGCLTKAPSYTHEDLRRYHKSPGDHRPHFQLDLDRLVHRPAFRRLQGKTQVVTPGQADFFRTRLTHTLEVAQVAREIVCRLFGKAGEYPNDGWAELSTAVQASAILHDLGHPPFGHAGERALLEAVDCIARKPPVSQRTERVRFGGFDGNAQSFHLATAGLRRDPGYAGLDLTRTVLDGTLKYPWERGSPRGALSKKWGVYGSDLNSFNWVRQPVSRRQGENKSFEAQIVEHADDVAYVIHDLEDWFKAGYVPIDILVRSTEERKILAERISPEDAGNVLPVIETLFADGPFTHVKGRYDGSRGAKAAMSQLRHNLYKRFLEGTAVNSKKALPCRHHNDLAVPAAVNREIDVLRDMIKVEVLSDIRMKTAEFGHSMIIKDLVKLHSADAFEEAGPSVFPRDSAVEIRELRERDDLPGVLRCVADYVAGMTDAYAIKLHGRLTGIEPGLFNEFL